jgi:hypothetical protein
MQKNISILKNEKNSDNLLSILDNYNKDLQNKMKTLYDIYNNTNYYEMINNIKKNNNYDIKIL